jgi:chaperonin cofactor prefoldin
MLSLDGVPPSKPILGNDLLEDTSTRAVRINSLESSSSNLSRTNSLTFGGTRSRENSVSSSEDLDVLLENIDDKFELTAALTRLQTNCNSVAMKLVHLQDELKESVSTAAATTTDSLQKHSDSLQSYSTIVSAAIQASTTLTTHHKMVKSKLNELEKLSTKIQKLKILATTLERHIESLTTADEDIGVIHENK